MEQRKKHESTLFSWNEHRAAIHILLKETTRVRRI